MTIERDAKDRRAECNCELCAMRRAMEELEDAYAKAIRDRDEARRELAELKAGREALRCPVA